MKSGDRTHIQLVLGSRLTLLEARNQLIRVRKDFLDGMGQSHHLTVVWFSSPACRAAVQLNSHIARPGLFDGTGEKRPVTERHGEHCIVDPDHVIQVQLNPEGHRSLSSSFTSASYFCDVAMRVSRSWSVRGAGAGPRASDRPCRSSFVEKSRTSRRRSLRGPEPPTPPPRCVWHPRHNPLQNP